MFYKNNKKIVPADIMLHLRSKLALAVWYLDDGALRVDSKAFRLHTNSFTLPEVELLKQTLLSNFDIQSTINKQGNGSILHIGSKSSQAENFSNLIKPFVASEVPSMLYKFF